MLGFEVEPKGHVRSPKGHSALWKRPSEYPAGGECYENMLPSEGSVDLA